MCDRAKPPKSQTERNPEMACGDWKMYRSTNGRAYYYHHKLKRNQWEKPHEWDDARAIKLANRAAEPNARPTPNGKRPRRVENAGKTSEHKRLPIDQAQVDQILNQFKKERGVTNSANAAGSSNGTENSTPSTTPKINPKKIWQKKAFANHNQLPVAAAVPNNDVNHHQGAQHHHHHRGSNGPGSRVSDISHVFKRKRNRVEEFERQVPKLPNLPDLSDFEALRPCADRNLIASEVRNLVEGCALILILGYRFLTNIFEIWNSGTFFPLRIESMRRHSFYKNNASRIESTHRGK